MTNKDLPLYTMTDDHLVEEIRSCESTMRALQAKQARFIAESERRGLHTRDGARSPSAWLRRLLNLQDRDARSRVLVACKAIPYMDASGQLVFAELAATAAALSSGEVSVAHARVIVDEIDKLPEWVSEHQRAELDVLLADQAKMLPPRELRVVAVRARHDLDPAVKESEKRRQVEQRRLRITTGRDGMTVLKGRLDKETGWKLRDVLDWFAGDPDGLEWEARSEPQRQADGLAHLVEFGISGADARGEHAAVRTKSDDGGHDEEEERISGCSPGVPSSSRALESKGMRKLQRANGTPIRLPLRQRARPTSRSEMPGSLIHSRWFLCRRPEGSS